MNNTPDETSRMNENSYFEVQELVSEQADKFTDEQMPESLVIDGIDLRAGVTHYVSTYAGTASFVHDLKTNLVKYGELTPRQIRAAMNVLQREIKTGKIKLASTDSRGGAIAVVKPLVKGEPAIEPEYEQPDDYQPVIASTEKSQLDVGALPDGRYAYLDPTGRNDMIFLMVRTTPRPVRLDRVYRYGKFRTGHEVLPTGTIIVREWSQDAKRLVGYQKPGEGYQGEFISELVGIMGAPKVWGLIFAKHIGRCSICGKTLTDEASRELATGPECRKRWGANYWERFSRSAVVAAPEEEND